MTYFPCSDYLNIWNTSDTIWQGFPKVDGKKVFVKPNLVMPYCKWNEESNSRVEVISFLLHKLNRMGVASTIVGDCGFKHQWEETLKNSSYDKLSSPNLQVVGLQEGENFHKFSLVRLEQYLSLFGARVSDFVLECDLIISVPKLKVHTMVGITGSIKNMMGTIAQKGSMHPKGDVFILHKRLRDLYFIFKDRVKFCLCDAIIGSEYAEHNGNPIQVGLLISSTDMWEMDVAMCYVMNTPPQKILYLDLIRKDLGRKFEEVGFPPFTKSFEHPIGWR